MNLRKENGSVLVLALVVMLSLLLLGGALIQYAVFNFRAVAVDEQLMQAYYIARSGADAMAEAIITDPTILDDIGLPATSEATSLGNGTFVVSINETGGNLNIVSTGEVNGLTQVVSLVLNTAGGGGTVPDFDMSIYAIGDGDASAPAIL